MVERKEIDIYELSKLKTLLNHKEPEYLKHILKGGFTELHLYPNQYAEGCFYSCKNEMYTKCYIKQELIKDFVLGSFGMCKLTGHFGNINNGSNDVYFIVEQVNLLTEEEIGEL